MKKIDWIYLRLPIIVCAVTLTLALLLLVSVNSYYGSVYARYTKQDKLYLDTKRKFDEARRNRALYQQYLAQYKNLQNNGVIGDEQRLSWIEEIQNINKKYRLSGLSYEISPQREAVLPKVASSPNVKIHVSTMQLKAGLLHEGDIVSLWQELRSNAHGLFALNQCQFESKFRREQPVTYKPYVSYVQLECQLDWYSVMAKTS